jgi:hypothetical protein
MNSDTKNSNYLPKQSISSKTNWTRERVTYQVAIPPKRFENGCLNLEIENWEPSKHKIFFSENTWSTSRGKR